MSYFKINVLTSVTADINDFLTNSGWFSYTGKPHGKEALHFVLAKKSGIEYGQFMKTKKAIYVFSFGNQEKIYIGISDILSTCCTLVFLGKAKVLHATLAEHFECFGKPKASIREIDDELCHHTDAWDWQLEIWPLADFDNLEVEWAKKVCVKESLRSSDERGLNESIKFTHKDNWVKFKKWLNPGRS